ncbi:MAG: cache and HAMP domain-containing protein [Chloroflexota bacterium]
MFKYFRSAIFRKVLLVLLVTALFPAMLLGWMAVRSGLQAGDTSTALSRAALIEKSQEALELRAVETAASIAGFLTEREADLRTFALITPNNQAYLAFSDSHVGELWGIAEGGEYREIVPLYRQLTYIDLEGQEIVKISEGEIAATSELNNLTDPGGTLYPNETYYQEALALPPGELYTGRVTANFLTREAYDSGERYQGVIRFAMPVYQAGQLSGVVVLALDVRHLIEFSSHIVPNGERFAAAPDTSTGSYAYLIDNRANTIAHPNQFYLIGLGTDGEQLPYVTSVEHIGTHPIRLDLLGFIDENLAGIHAVAMEGDPGSIFYIWQEKEKFVAYAPIPYFSAEYPAPGGFGWIGIAAEVNAFHSAATQVGATIQGEVQALMVNIVIVLVLGGVVSVPIVWLLARGIVTPIHQVTAAAQKVEQEDPDLSVLDPLLKRSPNDEMYTLANVFKRMASQVYHREATLKETISQLRIEINEVRKSKEVADVVESDYFKDIQQQAREIKKKKSEDE